LQKLVQRACTGLIWLKIGQVASSCEHSNQLSGSVKGENLTSWGELLTFQGLCSIEFEIECSLTLVDTLYLISMTSVRSSLNTVHLDNCKICNQPSCMEILIYWSVCDNRMSVVEGMGQMCGGCSSSSSSHGTSSRSNSLCGERLTYVNASHYFLFYLESTGSCSIVHMLIFLH
jgi:hypothetical protein